MLRNRPFVITLTTVAGMRDEMRRLQVNLQALMRKHEMQQVKLTRGEVEHLHRALIEADAKAIWLDRAVRDGHGEENFIHWLNAQT